MNKIYYWSHGNFGDELAPYLLEKITGHSFLYNPPPFKEPTVVSTGSILNLNILTSKAIIWGTGTLHTKSLNTSIKLFPLSRFFRTIKDTLTLSQPNILAVRGPNTRFLLSKIGISCPEIYGDPAILLPKYYTPKGGICKHHIGLVLHHTHHLSEKLATYFSSIGIQPISIIRKTKQDIEHFIDEICSCEKIFSSSLHAIITAQAYGIPAQWIGFNDHPIHIDDWHKFEDYFLGAGQDKQTKITIDFTKQDLHALTKISPPNIKPFSTADDLLNVFLDYYHEIEIKTRN